MNKLLISRRVLRPFMGLLLIVGTLFALAENVQAQKIRPSIPVLSLTGSGSTYNTDWYPDGRIWVPVSASNANPREFLMPVFIDNKWATYDQTANRYQADPIKSFEFSIFYDSSTVRAVGVVVEHPFTKEDATDVNRIDNRFKPYYEPLAKGFSFSVSDEVNTNYRHYLTPSIKPTDLDAKKGRLFRIVGTSTSALPNTDLQRDDFKVLLYVKFRVIPKEGPAHPSLSAYNSAIYINPESIRYNDLDVRKNAPFENRRKIDVLTAEEYPNPSSWTKIGDPVTGIAGNRNDDNNVQYSLEPVLPGTIYCRVMDFAPEFTFECSRGIGSVPALETVVGQNGQWVMVDPMTVDSSAYNAPITPNNAVRTIQIRNSLPRTRLVDVTIESDQPWLTFKCVTKGTASKKPLPMPNLTTNGYINFIDNNILGDASLGDPNGKMTVTDGELHLEIHCDPTRLALNDPATPDSIDSEKTGIHVGYLTFRSPFAGVKPVRIKITFIYFRNPIEMFRPGIPGINLTIANSDGQAAGGTGAEKLLVFGTGHRGTNGVDLLFGEKAMEYPPLAGEFEARWYPWADKYPAEALLYPNGFGDLSANDELARSNSRDIKDANETVQSLYYYCKFDAGGVNNYPVVLTWDTRDFPPGSQLFIRTILNGELQQAVNMRESTPLGNTLQSFTINDAREKEFLIEYTLPTVVDFVDANKKPIIKKGWNLLSLPVRPINAEWTNVYPNAINIPYYFSQNQYQSPTNGVLRPGIGYYVKYSNVVDKQFAGTYMYNISKNNGSGDEVKLYPGNGNNDGGWNSIGALSVPVSVNNIKFDGGPSGEVPEIPYTREYGIWGYNTDRGYEEVSQLLPGLGYWIKVNKMGFLRLEYPKQNLTVVPSTKNYVLASSTKLTVRDNAQHETVVYTSNNSNMNVKTFEMPPAPLAEMFDVRYSNNLYVTNENESVIKVQGVEYPISIEVANSNADLTFTDAVTGEFLGSVDAGATKNIVINGTSYNAIKVTKVETGAAQFAISNYPNPVSTISTFNYSITEESDVTVKLFDAMGVEVATLVNGHLTAGIYSGTLNANTLATGNYMLKLTAGNNSSVVKVSVVK